jgi:hypothetical protein
MSTNPQIRATHSFLRTRHDLSDVIVADLLSATGYRNSLAAPVPDALLINGIVSRKTRMARIGANAKCNENRAYTTAPQSLMEPVVQLNHCLKSRSCPTRRTVSASLIPVLMVKFIV